MASNHTANYGLSQWEPGDAFIREEFNQNFGVLDSALEAVETLARRSDAALPAIGYNLSNLLLQRYYDRKTTGWKKALIFDGFHDLEGIASKSEGVRGGSGLLYLDENGLGDYRSKVSAATLDAAAGSHWDNRWFADGCGTLTSITVFARCLLPDGATETKGTARMELWTEDEKKLLAASPDTAVGGWDQGTVFSLNCPVSVGESYRMRYVAVTVNGSLETGVHRLKCSDNNGSWFAYQFTSTPRPSHTGWMETPIFDVGLSYDRAVAWVRHRGGGSPELALRGAAEEAWTPMARGESRGVVDINQTACTETAYSLDLRGGPGAGMRMELSGSCQVIDYGAVLL